MNIYHLYFKTLIKNTLLFSLLLLPLEALVYEDAEDLGTENWSLISSSYGEKIHNIFDKEKVSRVIELKGHNTKSTYVLKCKEASKTVDFSKSTFEWEMKYLEDFVIIIEIETINGTRQLIYTLGENGSSFQFGLGKLSQGQWKKYTRNLEKDLNIFEKNNKLIKIKKFAIKGSGYLDNIRLNTIQKVIKHLPSKMIVDNIINKTTKKIEPIKKVSKKNHNINKLPEIKLIGNETVFLKIGEEYIENGAMAKDIDGSEINIKISHNIDVLKEGEYTVIYIAKNSLENSSIDKRRVIVGKISNQKRSYTKSREKSNLDDELARLKAESQERLELDTVVNDNKLEMLYENEQDSRPIRPGL